MSLNDLIDEINVVVGVPNVTASAGTGGRFTVDADPGYEISFSDDSKRRRWRHWVSTLSSWGAASTAPSMGVNQTIENDPNLSRRSGAGHVAGFERHGARRWPIFRTLSLTDAFRWPKPARLLAELGEQIWRSSLPTAALSAVESIRCWCSESARMRRSRRCPASPSTKRPSIILMFQRQFQAAARFIADHRRNPPDDARRWSSAVSRPMVRSADPTEWFFEMTSIPSNLARLSPTCSSQSEIVLAAHFSGPSTTDPAAPRDTARYRPGVSTGPSDDRPRHQRRSRVLDDIVERREQWLTKPLSRGCRTQQRGRRPGRCHGPDHRGQGHRLSAQVGVGSDRSKPGENQALRHRLAAHRALRTSPTANTRMYTSSAAQQHRQSAPMAELLGGYPAITGQGDGYGQRPGPRSTQINDHPAQAKRRLVR